MVAFADHPRDVADDDFEWIFALNAEHAIELSPLDPAELSALLQTASYKRVVDERAAFLIAFDQDAPYDGANFQWFKQRCERFFYVDRIAVASHSRGRGLARALYRDLFAHARARALSMVVCEVNSDPPNPASEAFHRSLGFREIGEARLSDRVKTVKYLRCDL